MSWTRRAFPKAHTSHRWSAAADEDNIECAYCAVRPYNADAEKPCEYAPKPDPRCFGERFADQIEETR